MRERLLAALRAQRAVGDLVLVEARIARLTRFMEYPSEAPHLSPALLREFLRVLTDERDRLLRQLGETP